MRLKIDIEKSIEKGKLIPKSQLTSMKDLINSCFFAIVFITCIIGPTVGIPVTITYTKVILILIVLLLFATNFFLVNRMDSLTKIENKDSKINVKYFHSLAKENNWKLFLHSENILIFNTTSWFLHERQLTIIFDKKNIFLNVMSFGNHDFKTPLYISKDKDELNQIIEKIKNNAT